MYRLLLLFSSCLITTPALAQSTPAYDQKPIGEYAKGVYKAGDDQIIYVAGEFKGTFNYKNVKDTFLKAIKYQVKKGLTLKTGKQFNRRLARDRHAVYGWYNKTRDKWVFYGFQIANSGTAGRRIDGRDGRITESNDWVILKHNTNGFKIDTKFGDDDKGGIVWQFSSPY